MARLVPAAAAGGTRQPGSATIRLARLGEPMLREGVGVTVESVLRAGHREYTSVLWTIRNDGVVNAGAPIEFRAPTGVSGMLSLRARVRRIPATGDDPIETVHDLAAPAFGPDRPGACVIAIPHAPWARAPRWRFCSAEMNPDGHVVAMHDLMRAGTPGAGCVLLALTAANAASIDTTQRS